MIKIKNLFIEGPDCSGKTTLINLIHKKTNYKYHIFDRSRFSQSVFNDMYNRNLKLSEDFFYEERNNLNNIYIVLLPRFKTIKERFEKRGDEIHDLKSIKKVHDYFLKHAKKIKKLSNFLIIENNNIDSVLERVLEFCNNYERKSLKDMSSDIQKNVSFCNNEIVGLSFSYYSFDKLINPDMSFLKCKSEKEYYEKIYTETLSKIGLEISGLNEYNRKETQKSRRFVYSDDSCISLVHFLYREDFLDVSIFLRSSNVRTILKHDTGFLYYLVAEVKKIIAPSIEKTKINFKLNSAHII